MSGRRKYLILLIGLFFFGLISFTIVSDSRKVSNEPIKMEMIIKVKGKVNDFWSVLESGAKNAAQEYNVELKISAPDSETDIYQQNRLVEEAISRGPKAIILAPADYENSVEIAKKIKEHKIKLILVDSDLAEDVEDTMVGTDNFAAGGKMGELVKQVMNEDSRIGLISHVQGASTAIEREQGLRDSLSQNADKIIGPYFCGSDTDKAYELTKELLKNNPEVDIMVGLNEYSAVGAARAVKELKLDKQIKLIGFDNSKEEAKLLEEGIFQGIVIQKSFNMGYLSVKNAVLLLAGYKVPAYVDSGSELITRENMYTIENQKLMFPFVEE